MEGIFFKYVYLNGIIEAETVIKLLQDNHDIQTTKSELDSIAKNNDIKIVKDKYYTFLEDMNEEDVDALLPLKKHFGKYKEASLIDCCEDYEADFRDDLEEIYDKKYGKIDDNFEELFFGIMFLIKYGLCTKQGIKSLLEELSFKVPNDLKIEIESLIKQYKNDISIWVYNGYSLNEYNELNKRQNKKIGRNEPCPCGSGKKYKKCCGK